MHNNRPDAARLEFATHEEAKVAYLCEDPVLGDEEVKVKVYNHYCSKPMLKKN